VTNFKTGQRHVGVRLTLIQVGETKSSDPFGDTPAVPFRPSTDSLKRDENRRSRPSFSSSDIALRTTQDGTIIY
jgi:hypothetical protein